VASGCRRVVDHATFNAPKKSMPTASGNSRKGARRPGDANTETPPSLAVVPEAADAVLAGTLSTGSR